MRDLYRPYIREFGFALTIGAVVVLATIVGLSVFTEPQPLQVADNQITNNPAQITAPVTEDTPGPIVSDSGVPDREISQKSPLADRDR